MLALRYIIAIAGILGGISLGFCFLAAPAERKKPFWLLTVYVVAVILVCIYFY